MLSVYSVCDVSTCNTDMYALNISFTRLSVGLINIRTTTPEIATTVSTPNKIMFCVWATKKERVVIVSKKQNQLTKAS